jgi:hypothetical protein
VPAKIKVLIVDDSLCAVNAFRISGGSRSSGGHGLKTRTMRGQISPQPEYYLDIEMRRWTASPSQIDGEEADARIVMSSLSQGVQFRDRRTPVRRVEVWPALRAYSVAVSARSSWTR